MADSEDNRSPHTVVVTLLASFLALLSGAIRVTSAITALLVVGSDPAYRSRVFYGWIALLCALVVPWGVLLTGRHRKTAMALTLLGGAVGAVAINLFLPQHVLCHGTTLLVARAPHGGDSVTGVKKANCLPCRLANNRP